MASFMKWDDSYSVGIQKIDDQHKKLIEIISDYYSLIKDDRKEAMSKTLDSLIEYTSYHFKTEEDLFDKYDFPGNDEHKKIHADFVNTALDVQKRYKEGKLVMPTEVSNLLKNWLIDHITGTDKKYITFLHDKGVK